MMVLGILFHAVFLSTLITSMFEGCFAKKGSVTVRGAGASFPRDVYDVWIVSYQTERSKHTDVTMMYDGIGSGNGKAVITGTLTLCQQGYLTL